MEESSGKGPRLYQQVADKIAEMIEERGLDAGTRLPAERELASIYKVSRPTIREAVIALEIAGVVEVRTGSGVYILDRTIDQNHVPDQDIGPFELTEARALIEGEAAALAASMITDEELEVLEGILNGMSLEDEEGREEADREFHLTIARATRNSAIVGTIEYLWDQRENSVLTRRMYEKVRSSVLGVKPTFNEHNEIYLALKARDAQGARNAMRAHLMRVIDGILEATETEAIEAAREQVSRNRERFTRTRSIG